jgi:hypothetical protein
MRRALITWSVAFGLLIVGFIATVAILNATLYSAHGFVQSYLEALARHDSAGALELADIHPTDAPADDLLSSDYLGELENITLESELPTNVGTSIAVTFSYEIDGKPGSSEFVVQPNGTVLGLFTAWRFTESPLSTVALTVLHDARFEVNGEEHITPAEPNAAAQYRVFTPGVYEFAHDSRFLTAAPVAKTVTKVGGSTQVVVDVQANEAFVSQVQEELNAYFDEECVTQTVLLPTACPFGQPMGNRIVTTPVWSMAEYPEVTIVPGDEQGTWLMPTSSGAAHLVVDVQSLFDGSISTFDEDVRFSVSYLITFLPDGELYIERQD